ncbi:MAG: hypothetical protein U0235_15840 [Polyangiaceae bacterium]
MRASAFRVSASVTLALALSFVLVVACSDKADTRAAVAAPDAGADADADASVIVADADGAACALPASYGSRSCNACMVAHCCDVITACEGEATCKPLEKCVTDCLSVPDAGACRTACLAQHPDGETTWLKVEACWFNDPPRCGVACT